VLITDDVTNFGFDPFGCKVHTTGCTEDIATYQSGYLPNYEKLLSAVKAVPGVRLMRTAQYMCTDRECSMTRAGEILYADPSHLNVLGSRYVGRRIVAEYGAWLE